MITRRHLLIRGGGAAGTLLATGAFANTDAAAHAAQSSNSRGARPKNIIFCVADGQGMAAVTMADQYQRYLLGRPSYLATLLEDPAVTTGLERTSSLSSVVTDSAAASSAWGSGRHIFNKQLNIYPDGTKLTPIASILRDSGKMRIGLVTTTTVTHATPAGFAISTPDRDLEGLIAEQYLVNRNVDVLMGGGNRFFAADKRPDKRDLYVDFAKAGYVVAKTKAEMKTVDVAKGEKLLGVFNDSHMPFTVDHVHDANLLATRPTLADMTRTALASLQNAPAGFLLQIEGGRVDHAGHADDLAALLFDQIAYEDAVKVAVEFARKDKNTLVIITADHATGGPSLNGAGEEYSESTARFLSVKNHKASYQTLLPMLGKSAAPDKVQSILAEKLGVKLTQAEATAITNSVAGVITPASVEEFMRAPSAVMGAVLSNHTAVSWTSLNHTSEHCLTLAIGPGQERFAGLHDNVSYFDTLLALKDIKFSNPKQMDFETGKKFHSKTMAALRADRELYARYAAHDDCHCDHDGTAKTHVVAR